MNWKKLSDKVKFFFWILLIVLISLAMSWLALDLR